MPGEPPVAASAFFSATSVPVAREFDYDDANRMHAVRHDGVVAMRYLYNAMGERVHRAGSGIAVATLYDEDGKWIGDYDANGQPIQQVVWLDDLPVGLLVGAGANQKLYYIEADALGTPRVVIDPVRNVAVWNWNLADEAFGDSAPDQDVDGDGSAFVFDMRFPGQRYDSATGLNYNYFRDYDPGTGRYAQSDPIGLGGGMTTYGYAEGSPLVYSDPEGLYVAQILFRLGMRYLAPKLAAGAIKRVTPRLVRGGIKRVAWHGPKQPPACIKRVTISRTRYPESAKHIDDAIASGKPKKLTIDRANAKANRRESLRGVEPRRGLDRDEYPPAMFKEGGQGASVRHITPRDNRGAGACMGAQCRGLPNGSRIRIDVVD